MIETEQVNTEEKNKSENESYREKLVQLKADFANYKRRIEREKEERMLLANEELIGKILPVLDDFERAVKTDTDTSSANDWMKGVKLVGQNLRTILENEGLTRFDPTGDEFDPEDHEAVFIEEGTNEEQGKVKQVIKPGYRLHEKLIRPAHVSVVKGIKEELKPKVVKEEEETGKTVNRRTIPIRKRGDIGLRQARAAPRTRSVFF